MTTIADIRERLTEIRPPGFSEDIVGTGAVRGVDFRDGVITVHLLPPPMPPASLNATVADIRRALGAFDGVREVRVEIAGKAGGGAAPQGAMTLPGVRDILAVSSTKGGVGKSTVAANLALAFHQLGWRVGLMDSDVYGPSVPTMFGLASRPQVSESKRIAPHERYGVKLMSIGFFLDDSSPVIWRGPLVMGLVRQFLTDVDWGELDLLVVDLPPGTGDAQLTLVQQVPLSGAVVVTTPQDVAALDVERGVAMFRHVNTPVLGLIENMSVFHCPHCGQEEEIFGHGAGEKIAARFQVPLLGRLALDEQVRASGDAGKPIVLAQPEHPCSRTLLDIARQLRAAIERERETSAQPTILG